MADVLAPAQRVVIHVVEIGGELVVADDVIARALDEDDGLRGYEDIDEGIEKIGRDEFAEHQGPGIRNMTCFKSGSHGAVGDLDDQQPKRNERQPGR